MTSILRWHFLDAPVWLIALAWNLQHMLVRFFSVPLMLRTLFSHWRRDVVSYQNMGLSKVLLAWSWNVISRFIGFGIRATVLGIYGIAALSVGIVSVIVLIAFVVWPIVSLGLAGLYASVVVL